MQKSKKRLIIFMFIMFSLVLISCGDTEIFLETPRVNQANIQPVVQRGTIQVFVSAKNNETTINYAITDSTVEQLSLEDFTTSDNVILSGSATGVLNRSVTELEDDTFYHVFVALELNNFQSDVLLFSVKTVSEIETLIQGTGIEEDPFLIFEAWQLAAITTDEYGFTDSSHYRLMNDIDLSSYENWVPIGAQNGNARRLKGVFNGGGHTISNLRIRSTAGLEKWGLFRELDIDGAIINLNLDNVDIEVDGFRIAALVGYAKGLIHQIHVTNAKIIQPSGEGQVGGIVGAFFDSGSLTNSSFEGEIKAAGRRVGGIVGAATTSKGFNRVSISDVFFTGSVEGTANTARQVGGILGAGTGISLNAAIVDGTVSGVRQIGGIVGFIEASAGADGERESSHLRNLVFIGSSVFADASDGNSTIAIGYILGDGSSTRPEYEVELVYSHNTVLGGLNNTSSKRVNGELVDLEVLLTVEFYQNNLERFNFNTTWQIVDEKISLRR